MEEKSISDVLSSQLRPPARPSLSYSADASFDLGLLNLLLPVTQNNRIPTHFIFSTSWSRHLTHAFYSNRSKPTISSPHRPDLSYRDPPPPNITPPTLIISGTAQMSSAKLASPRFSLSLFSALRPCLFVH